MTYQDIKQHLTKEGLISLLEALGYSMNRQSQFSLRDENTPSTSINPKNLQIKDFGSGWSGDIFDLLKEYHAMNDREAKTYVMESLRLSEHREPVKKEATTTQHKDSAVLKAKLQRDANTYLTTQISKFRYFHDDKELILNYPFRKLFDANYLTVREEIANYIFTSIIGYCNYFDCPVIILKDAGGEVVNIVKYRPHNKQGEEFTKYLYLNASEKPQSDYLYPFQRENERMMSKQSEKLVLVGEGLKNALIALIYEIPYISIESTSSINPKLLEYLKAKEREGLSFIGSFDGDVAGERAFNSVREVIEMNNLFTFDSGVDFGEHITKDEKRGIDE